MSEVRLSAAIMAHPKRADMVGELRELLDRDVPVVWDRINDRHDTGIRAMQAYDRDATHHLVIQDDVVPCRDLLAGVEQSLQFVPDDMPACFYIGQVQPFSKAVAAAVSATGPNTSWIAMSGPFWGTAIAVPTAVIDDLAKWWGSPDGQRVSNYDRRIYRFFLANGGGECRYSWPSLVEHRGDLSLVRPRSGVRTSHKFLGADVSALDVDWSGPVTGVVDSERLDRRRERRAARSVG